MSTAPRSNRRLIVAIAAMVVVWAVVMLYRNELRARWWERQLRQAVVADDADGQVAHFARLAGLKSASVEAAGRLLDDDDASVRSFGVALLQQRIENDRAGELLAQATSDPDAHVRREAILSLGVRGDGGSIRELLAAADVETVRAAVEALAIIGDAPAIRQLVALVPRSDTNAAKSDPAVRVQAIVALGELGATEAVPALTGCLDDPTLFEGETAAERSAARAIAALRPGDQVQWPAPKTVGQYAAEALAQIEGQPASAPSVLDRSVTKP